MTIIPITKIKINKKSAELGFNGKKTRKVQLQKEKYDKMVDFNYCHINII